MINEKIKITVRTLFNSGKPKKEIARLVGIDIKTVRRVIQSESDEPKERVDKVNISEELLQTLYISCNGYAHRMYEKLSEEYEINIGYSTLTRYLREMGIGKTKTRRSGHYQDVPGEEMQHDTSPYTILIGDVRKRVVCSGLYIRYSKMRYIKFYPVFNRFTMQCFLYEALRFFGYACDTCIIDNTNLAVQYGTGENAVFNPEMVQFANQFSFRWKAHRIKHSNRKAGIERSFYTVETSFFPGRTFADFKDLNVQAKQWATVRLASRPQSKTKLIPLNLFEYEKPFLHRIDDSIQSPYRISKRLIDAYGYIAFNGNYYWIPETAKGRDVKIIRSENEIWIYQHHNKLIEYNLPEYDVKNKRFSPPGIKTEPNNRKNGASEEETYLRTLGSICCSYLNFIHSGECRNRQKSRLIRDLYSLSKKLSDSIFTGTLERALEYKVYSIRSIERIAQNLLQNDLLQESDIPFDSDYQSREEYQKGRFSSEADLKSFQKLIDEKEVDNE